MDSRRLHTDRVGLPQARAANHNQDQQRMDMVSGDQEASVVGEDAAASMRPA